MIDHETIFWSLLDRDLISGTYFSSETNIAADFEIPLPAIIYSLTNTGQTQNGPNLWTGQVDVQILGDPEPAWDLAANVYDILHQWADEQTGVVDDVGWVQDVTDISAFSRPTGTQIVGKGVIQYAGSFALALRN